MSESRGLEKLYLVDEQPALVEAWTEVFEGDEAVEPRRGDLFSQPADAMLSPANSFGIMDGGIDLAIREHLGFETESRLQRRIVEEYHGELPVGSALIVRTDSPDWPYLVAAPTMRVPEPVPYSLNAYLAFRAALLAIWHHNRSSEDKIRSLAAPGIATGIGKVSPRRCAGHMRVAWQQLRGRPRIPSYEMIHRVHEALLRTE